MLNSNSFEEYGAHARRKARHRAKEPAGYGRKWRAKSAHTSSRRQRHAPGTRDPPPVCEIIGPSLATAFFPFSALMSALQFVRLFIAFIK